jgi:hypothetical protein
MRGESARRRLPFFQGRLAKRVARLNDKRLIEVCAALRFSLGCNPL